VSQHTAKTRSKHKTSAPDYDKVDSGTVSAAKANELPIRHLRRSRPQVFLHSRDCDSPIASSLQDPFRCAWRAGGRARVRYPRAA